MRTPVDPALDAVIDDPEAVMDWYRATSLAEQAIRDQIRAEDIAVDSAFKELGLAFSCSANVSINVTGGVVRSVFINSTFQEITAAQWQQIAAFMREHHLDTLNVRSSPDTDLDFLQHFDFLTALNFGETMTNVDGLHCLTDKMTWIAWGANRKFSLEVLRRFPHLRVLAVGPAKDFEVVADLRELCWLSMDNTGLADLSMVTGLPHLRRVSMGSGKPPDLSALATLPELELLQFDRWRKLGDADLAPIADCVNLRVLEIDSVPNITTLPDMSRLTKLRVVSLQNMKTLVDLAGLAAAPNLTWAWIDSKATTAQSVTPLVGHPKLTSLTVACHTDALCEQLHALIPADVHQKYTWNNTYIYYRAAMYHHTGSQPGLTT
ncbi:hypothetical protein [Mycolicibacterium mageritense]|uniref:hypothetical protein n=1 Tax=Mycolicibacterium mageritense TaxID=53462 RepID=UPI0011D5FA30|nr:hypothetical protein [Mycolicibacterium mageritense]MBN3457556.1 hypothetical protein [Mycobacterium sp. DSM 3803]TXI62413.1 MAG: hypothetical protein E6Q55_12945 [Mycolicibacterium mageritense]